jgi:L-Ala-D/L-Glu epimerase
MSEKIARVEVFGVAVPLVGSGFRNAYVTKTVQKSALVRLTSANGAVGLGNIDPSPGYSIETIDESLRALRGTLSGAVLGMDALNVHAVLERLDGCVSGFLDAKAAIEMACVDLASRVSRVPVSTYLGGAVRDEFLFNAWIGILEPDAAAAEARKWFERGFRSAKIKVGGDIEADRERVKAVREAVGKGMALRIDANAGYDVETSIKLARLMAPYELQLIEQPVAAGDIAGLARVRREAGVPIMADEAIVDHRTLVEVIRAGAADIVKLKVMKNGGFLRTQRMAATAEAAGIRVVVGHGFGLGVNTLAEIQFASTSMNILDGLECVGPLKTTDDITTKKLDLSSGRLALRFTEPGLGATLDEAKLRRYRFD